MLTIKTSPFSDQVPGTSGLRRKVAVFTQEHYLENYLQSVFDTIPTLRSGRLVVGGDGRFHNRAAIQTLLRMAAANGIASVALGTGGLLSTPAAAHLIRVEDAAGGFLLTASHNPAGPTGDWGIKFNIAGGGQPPEAMTRAIVERTRCIDAYRMLTGTPDIDIDRPGSVFLGDMRVDVIDPVAAYADHMESLFDFDGIREGIKRGITFRFDAMHAVAGPYADEIFIRRLGFPEISLLHTTPREDFGGLHADPNAQTLPDLLALAQAEHAPDLLAASDGDGDRNLIMGPGGIVSPSDSLAIITANASLLKGYPNGANGVARSMPTSHAVDRVAQKLGIPCFETPTGWRYFCNLLDSGRINFCGEESFGTSSDHCREKDGIWAVLCWLSLMAETGLGVDGLLHRHWTEFGRTFTMRTDFVLADKDLASRLYADLKTALPDQIGRDFAGRTVVAADEFAYDDPVDRSHSAQQGLRLQLAGEARVVFRLSGTDAAGATLRIYIEDHTSDPARLHGDAVDALRPLAEAARDLARITPLTGMTTPTLTV